MGIERRRVVQYGAAIVFGLAGIHDALARVVDDDQGPDKSAFIVGDRADAPDSNTVKVANLPTITELAAQVNAQEEESIVITEPNNEILSEPTIVIGEIVYEANSPNSMGFGDPANSFSLDTSLFSDNSTKNPGIELVDLRDQEFKPTVIGAGR